MDQRTIEILCQVALKAAVETAAQIDSLQPGERVPAVMSYADDYVGWLVNSIAANAVEETFGNADKAPVQSQQRAYSGNGGGYKGGGSRSGGSGGRWKFPFGKHKGKSIAQIAETDAGYLEWYLDNGEKEDVLEQINAFFDQG